MENEQSNTQVDIRFVELQIKTLNDFIANGATNDELERFIQKCISQGLIIAKKKMNVGIECEEVPELENELWIRSNKYGK